MPQDVELREYGTNLPRTRGPLVGRAGRDGPERQVAEWCGPVECYRTGDFSSEIPLQEFLCRPGFPSEGVLASDPILTPLFLPP